MPKKNSCKICSRPDAQKINSMIINGEKNTEIIRRFNLNRATFYKHKRHVQAAESQFAAVPDRSKTTDKSSLEQLMDRMQTVADATFTRASKLFDACDEWLSDPKKPEKYNLDPRAKEVEVIYQTVNDDGEMNHERDKANLQELIDYVASNGKIHLRNIHWRISDPRATVLQSAKHLENAARLLFECQKKLEEFEMKKEIMEQNKPAESNGFSFWDNADEIVKRVNISLAKAPKNKYLPPLEDDE